MDSAKHLLLIGLSKDKPEHGADETEGAKESGPDDEAIDEMFRELKAGNHEGAREAFKSAVKICMMSHNEENEKDAGY